MSCVIVSLAFPKAKDTLATSAWLRKLQKEEPDEYKKVFKDFRDNVPNETGGRAKRRTPWKPRQLIATKVTEATRQSRFSNNFEDMRLGRFIEFFTKEADPDERMTEAEARISFLREPKKKVKVYSIKRQKHIEVEVVSVATGLTRHNEHIGAERNSATEVLETVNNATDQQVDAARAKVMTAISDSFDDDMFAEIWLHTP